MKLREQLDQMQTLMEQLVKMVGHNNAVTEELSQRMDSLETKVDKLEAKVDHLESKFINQENKLLSLENQLLNLESKVTDLDTRMEQGFSDVVQMITVLGEKVDRMETT